MVPQRTSRPLVLGLMVATGAYGWGYDGHMVVAQVAQTRLNEYAAAQVDARLGGASMASVASWADGLRNFPEYACATPLHYADTPVGACDYVHERDCHNDICVVGAISNFTSQLLGDLPGHNQTEAVQFLIHFLGDIHQPLHQGYLDDLGGNRISVKWYGAATNLHAVWDYNMIDSIESVLGSDWTGLAAEVSNRLSEGYWGMEQAGWASCSDGAIVCPSEWADESASYACSSAYEGVTAGDELGDDYYGSRSPVVLKRLAAAGVRLAAALNRIWSA
jgi:hypothetical protein